MNNTIEFISEGGGERIDKFLSLKMSDFTRSHIQKLTDDGYVTVNEVKVKPNYKIKSGDIVLTNQEDRLAYQETNGTHGGSHTACQMFGIRLFISGFR